MLIKKFVSDTETNAIMKAKNELGNDAVVMNIKKIQPKGLMRLFMKPKVEVTAAVDDNVKTSDNESAQSKTSLSSTNVNNSGSKIDVTISEKNEKSFIPNNNTLDALEKAMKNGELGKTAGQNKKEEKAFNDQVKKDQVKKDEVKILEEKLDSMNDSLQNLIESKIKSELEKEKITDNDMTEESEEDKEIREKCKKLEACKQLIYEQLVNAEVDDVYAKELIDEVEEMISPDTTINSVLACIYQKIILKLGQPKLIYNEKGQHAKYSFFVGPTGVGKTTTIAKIVSDLKLNKKAKVALITADTYRIAAVEQLKTYANILDVPIRVIYSAEEMTEVMKELKDFEYVLVDTAGRSHLNKEQQEDLKKLLDVVEDKDVYLTLSITTKYTDLLELSKIYSELSDYTLIFTKLDETKGIGNIYNLRRNTGANLSYVTNGQNVPDDFSKLDTQYIAKTLLGGKV